MCHAILAVSYRKDKEVKMYPCDSSATTNSKIVELQSLPEVVKIGVFLCSQYIERTESWKATPYNEVLPGP